MLNSAKRNKTVYTGEAKMYAGVAVLILVMLFPATCAILKYQGKAFQPNVIPADEARYQSFSRPIQDGDKAFSELMNKANRFIKIASEQGSLDMALDTTYYTNAVVEKVKHRLTELGYKIEEEDFKATNTTKASSFLIVRWN